MINNKHKKHILLLLLSTFIVSIPNIIYALNGNGFDISAGWKEEPSPSEESGGSTGESDCAKAIRCDDPVPQGTGYHVTKEWIKVSFKKFNQFDTLAMDESVIAGTSFGANLYEQREVEWSCSKAVKHTCYIKVTPKTNEFSTCRAANPGPYSDMLCAMHGQCDPCQGLSNWGTPHEEQISCDYSDQCSFEEKLIEQANLENHYINGARGAYTITIPDPNDIKSTEYKEAIAITKSNIIEGQLQNPIMFTTYYQMYGVCMNKNTSKVRYLQTSEDSCNSDEMYIKNYEQSPIPTEFGKDNSHSHIFVPLNAKTTDTFVFSMGSNSTEEVKMCKAIMETYPTTYANYIIPINSDEFTGTSYDSTIIDNDNGCRLQTIIPISIVQNFYNEVEENGQLVFKGFNFFYRPIDITNPFPNLLVDNLTNAFNNAFGTGLKESYWKSVSNVNNAESNTILQKEYWYYSKTDNVYRQNNNSGTEVVKMENSYNEITYKSTNVRKINETEDYTSWNNINSDGMSSIISTSGGDITRINADISKIYKLGCGPQNKSQYLRVDRSTNEDLYNSICDEESIYNVECTEDHITIPNPYYQEECAG